ncbi:MAG: nitrate reductase cytochrome c-type subunit [Burkholderiaceae bacterium]|nr:nitrate reductase cytochrome c-type subunit [Burkholderiaceae bacterium]
MPTKMAALAAAAAVLYGCAHFSGVSSLRGVDVAAVDKAPAEQKVYVGKRPGVGQLIARTFDGQPPLVPHAVDNFDEITVTDNQCLECHSPETAKAKNAPVVADTHLVADKHTINDARYQCNTCHVPQVDAPPLIANSFVGTPSQPVKR